MARSIAQFEEEQASSVNTEDWFNTHKIMKDLWMIVDRLDQSFHPSQRPSPIEILIALGDQRKPVSQHI